jgi:hypothetical protein
MRLWIRVGVGVGLAVALVGCRPTTQVVRTTPLANLQPYTGVVVRASRAKRRRAHGLAYVLESAAVERIRARCAFTQVHGGSDAPPDLPADLFLDVTVQGTFRGGGGGLIRNENQATVDVKLVLSDGVDEELVGSADIRGTSGGIIVNNASPEEEAVTAVADTIAKMLVRSGCAQPRVARARPPARKQRPDVQTADLHVDVDQKTATIARAEAENDEGKRLFRAADVPGAKRRFEAAIRLHRDPRYVFNMCLAEEALGRIDVAVSTCKEVLAMKPEPALAEKTRLRLKILAEKRP